MEVSSNKIINETVNEQSKLPLVSVCVQTYQHVDFIAQCLDSILMQKTNFPFEIILGEDESSDGTREKCIEYAIKFPNKINLFLRSRQDVIYVNGNPTGRFNMLQNLKAASGKFIALLEGDDYWTDPLKLQKQVDFLEANPNLIACHHWQKIAKFKNGKFVEEEAPKEGVGYFDCQVATVEHIFLNRLRLKSRTLMFKNINVTHDFLKFFNNVAYGDVPLTFVLGKYGDFGFINEEMAVYRLTDKGASTAGLKQLGFNKFKIQHYKNWITIWDKANTYYNYQYNSQATKTVSYFYEELFKSMSSNPRELLRILNYNFNRNIQKSGVIKHVPLICKLYIKCVSKKIKMKYL